MCPLIGISRPTHRRCGRAPRVRRRLAARRDPVVDDLEAVLVEALRLGEVVRQALRDRDVEVREAGDSPVGKRERAPLAELVEAVLRRDADRNRRQGACHQPVRVRVNEMRMQDVGPLAGEVARQPHERDRVDVAGDGDRVEVDAA